MMPSRAVVDSCVWISAFVESDVDHFKAVAFVDQVMRGRHRVYAPCVVIAEVVCRIAARYRLIKRDPSDAIDIRDELRALRNVEWINVDVEFAATASQLGIRHRLRGVDALVAQTAIAYSCEFRTTDDDFLKSTIANVIKVRPI